MVMGRFPANQLLIRNLHIGSRKKKLHTYYNVYSFDCICLQYTIEF